MSRLRALVVASHPLPTASVVAFAVAYGAALGASPSRLVLLAAAVLTGQLSIGWANDAVDGDRDRRARRPDKPVATGALSRPQVWVAAATAAAACVPLSFALGLVPGTLHVVAVASGWAYDLGLKATPLSPLPYLLSFGLLACVVASAADTPGRSALPASGVVLAAGLLGVAAHFANTVGDTEADAATGVRGLPQRIGPAASLRVTAVGVAAAAGLLVSAVLAGGADAVALVLLGVGVVLACGGVLVPPRASRSAFRLTLAAVGVVLAGFLRGA